MARQLFDTGLFSVLASSSGLGSGWKLNFYTGGTATRTDTYNHRTAGSANANPVVADANGRFGEIWVPDNQTIKWVLTDSADVVKLTRDNVLIPAAPATAAAGLTTFLAGTDPLPIANGGTNATSEANARTNLAVLGTAGGTMTGDIGRSTKGDYLYFNTAALTNAEVFLTASASADPRGGLPGQIWLKY